MPYWKYGEDAYLDDVALLLNKMAKRCAGCKRVTRNQYLEDGQCPECRGVAAPDQTPARYNAGVQ